MSILHKLPEHLERYVALAVATIGAIALALGAAHFIQPHALPAPVAPTGTRHPALTAVSPVPTAAPAATTAPASSTEAPAVGPVLLPAQPAPAGLQPGRVIRSIAAAAAVTGAAQPDWTALATAGERSTTSSWSTASPRRMAAIAPSTGLLRTRLTGWIQFAHSGTHMLILAVADGPARAALTLDGQPQALEQVDRPCNAWTAACPLAPTNAAASIGLATGWHEIEVTAVTDVGAHPAIISLYARGPLASMPAALIPSAPRAAAIGGAP